MERFNIGYEEYIDRGTISSEATNGDIQLSWREFSPLKEEHPDEATVFLPGWPMDARTTAISEFPKALARYGNNRTYALNTITQEPTTDLSAEVDADITFLHQHGVKKATITAHSLGSLYALAMAARLKQLRGTPDEIKVNGLILFDAAGMFDQHGLPAKFVKDLFVTLITESGSGSESSKSAPKDMLFSIAERIKFAQGEFPKVFWHQLGAMTHKSFLLAEIDDPVLFMQGENDKVFDIKRTVPIQPSENRYETARLRRDYMKKNIFTGTKNVELIVPTKHSVHAGLTGFRYDQAARVSLQYLRRMNLRSQRDLNPQPHP